MDYSVKFLDKTRACSTYKLKKILKLVFQILNCFSISLASHNWRASLIFLFCIKTKCRTGTQVLIRVRNLLSQVLCRATICQIEINCWHLSKWISRIRPRAKCHLCTSIWSVSHLFRLVSTLLLFSLSQCMYRTFNWYNFIPSILASIFFPTSEVFLLQFQVFLLYYLRDTIILIS